MCTGPGWGQVHRPDFFSSQVSSRSLPLRVEITRRLAGSRSGLCQPQLQTLVVPWAPCEEVTGRESGARRPGSTLPLPREVFMQKPLNPSRTRSPHLQNESSNSFITSHGAETVDGNRGRTTTTGSTAAPQEEHDCLSSHPRPLLTSCVTLGKLLNVSVLQFPLWYCGLHTSTLAPGGVRRFKSVNSCQALQTVSGPP